MQVSWWLAVFLRKYWMMESMSATAAMRRQVRR